MNVKQLTDLNYSVIDIWR